MNTRTSPILALLFLLLLPASGIRHVANSSTATTITGSTLPTNLAVLAEKCQCKFVGLCTCPQAAGFMDCLADACASGACTCDDDVFEQSCGSMAHVCPTVGLECGPTEATCLQQPLLNDESIEKITEDLDLMKERKCGLEAAHHGGLLNADNRLRELEPAIQARLHLLKTKGVGVVPSMDCGPSHPYRSDSQPSMHSVPHAPVSTTLHAALSTTLDPLAHQSVPQEPSTTIGPPVVAHAIAAPPMTWPMTSEKFCGPESPYPGLSLLRLRFGDKDGCDELVKCEDKDGDGVVSEAEFKKAPDCSKGTIVAAENFAAFDKLDWNHDTFITAGEGFLNADQIGCLDTNNDGKVSWDEFGTGTPTMPLDQIQGKASVCLENSPGKFTIKECLAKGCYGILHSVPGF